MIEVKNLKRSFRDGEVETQVLKGIDLKVETGEFIAIMGRSGAGKSTLMYQMSLLDEPTAGEIIIDDHDTHLMTAEAKTKFRLEKLGYVFQDYALIPELTALENVLLPLLMKGVKKDKANEMSFESLSKVGLVNHLHQLPSQLSGGEQQRASIARAIAHEPNILFADEPTANLDNESSRAVMKIFLELHQAGQTIIMVTHEEPYGKMAEKIVRIDDGKIIETEGNKDF
ncbi:MAG: ABC transporter ATP-binding protein [Candidatus Paceibacterota bacterium]|jgi:putative ABC transport system ATP-binding protein